MRRSVLPSSRSRSRWPMPSASSTPPVSLLTTARTGRSPAGTPFLTGPVNSTRWGSAMTGPICAAIPVSAATRTTGRDHATPRFPTCAKTTALASTTRLGAAPRARGDGGSSSRPSPQSEQFARSRSCRRSRSCPTDGPPRLTRVHPGCRAAPVPESVGSTPRARCGCCRT